MLGQLSTVLLRAETLRKTLLISRGEQSVILFLFSYTPPFIDHIHRPKEKPECEYIPKAVQMVRYQTHFCDLMGFACVPSFLLFIFSMQHK